MCNISGKRKKKQKNNKLMLILKAQLKKINKIKAHKDSVLILVTGHLITGRRWVILEAEQQL